MDTFKPQVELMDGPAFVGLVQAMKMFVLLAVPEPRRSSVLRLLRYMVRTHSSIDDGLEQANAMLLQGLDALEDTAASMRRNLDKKLEE